MFKVLFPILNLYLACKQLYFTPGKGINKRNESTKNTQVVLLIFCSTDDNIQYCFFPTLYYSKQLEVPNWFSFAKKDNEVLTANLHFYRGKWQLLETRGNWQH